MYENLKLKFMRLCKNLTMKIYRTHHSHIRIVFYYITNFSELFLHVIFPDIPDVKIRHVRRHFVLQ